MMIHVRRLRTQRSELLVRRESKIQQRMSIYDGVGRSRRGEGRCAGRSRMRRSSMRIGRVGHRRSWRMLNGKQRRGDGGRGREDRDDRGLKVQENLCQAEGLRGNEAEEDR